MTKSQELDALGGFILNDLHSGAIIYEATGAYNLRFFCFMKLLLPER